MRPLLLVAAAAAAEATTAAAGVLPHTCEPGSPSFGLPFCDFSLPVDARVADLVSRLSPRQKLDQLQIPVGRVAFDAALNLKGWVFDVTCIHGAGGMPGALKPHWNTTAYPHAIALGATFDVALVRRVAAASRAELRAMNVLNYNLSGGTSWQATSCDGGPLSNTAVDPRYGRISETYGEDPLLTSTLASAVVDELQLATPDGRFLATIQVVRHLLGYHYANDLPRGGEETVSALFFEDQQAPAYSGPLARAEGVMCAMSAFSIAGSTMTPSCVHPVLWQQLRSRWNSSSFVMTDCCDSISAMVDQHHFFASDEDAVVASLSAGVVASYSYGSRVDAAVNKSLADGRLTQATLDAAVSRTLLARFKVGEFDTINPANPYPFSSWPANGVIEAPAHRALAREAAARSLVVLENRGGLLPLAPGLRRGRWRRSGGGPLRIAVVGPFSHCTDPWGGYGITERDPPDCSYLHSYVGSTSSVITVWDAIAAEAAASGGSIVANFSVGSFVTSSGPPNATAAAAALAAASDVVLLSVALGTQFEAEGNDRASLSLPAPQQALLEAVSAAAGPARVVLLVHSAGGVDFDPSLIESAMQVWYAGEEAGNGIADVLFGRVAPSGRLPVTIYKDEYLSKVPPLANFDLAGNSSNGFADPSVGRTHRYLNSSAAQSLVRYNFGFGLSWSRFVYSGLTLAASPDGATVNVSAVVTNAGGSGGGEGFAAREVVQVYMAPPRVEGQPTPAWNLVAFDVTADLAPQSSTTVSFSMPRSAFSVALADGSRRVTGGQYTIFVSGHTPGDAEGTARASNVVSAVIEL